MFFAGLDLSRKRLDVHIVDVAGRTVLETPRHRTPTGCAAWSSALSRWGR